MEKSCFNGAGPVAAASARQLTVLPATRGGAAERIYIGVTVVVSFQFEN